MTTVARHARGLVIAFVVLMLSAGVVLGARALPAASTNGLETAAGAAGKVVPVADQFGDEEDPAAPVSEEDEDAEEGAEAEEADAEDLEADNHGAIVSEAAQMETPEGFVNHGAWVSCVTHLTKLPVEEGAEPLTLEDITPEACAALDEAKQAAKDAAREARDARKAEAKAARDAAKAERAAKRAAKHAGN